MWSSVSFATSISSSRRGRVGRRRRRCSPTARSWSTSSCGSGWWPSFCTCFPVSLGEIVERRVRAYAKINLGLRVLSRRPDGFHEIDTLLQSIDLADRLIFRLRSDGRLLVRADRPDVPDGADNLVHRALGLLRAEAGRPELGMEVEIEKRIPPGAGLGGGSSDAACALLAGRRLWDLTETVPSLAGLAAAVGSDVPFFLRGGLCRATGRGEKLEALDGLGRVAFGLVLLPVGLATAQVYRRHALSLTRKPLNARMAHQLTGVGDARDLADLLVNDLEATARAMLPELKLHMDRLRSSGIEIVTMTGSGSAFYFWPAAGGRMRRARELLRGTGCRVERVRATRRGWIWDDRRRTG
ncbi:MAG: 4-(cytidine 5'-diphospho)-2-C-methyl-D-erythritol kinase [Candidatus Eisenbacteria bacterium]|nr:4-(cytidine 5'-diphospho)-2-C-methyl-D-erythritol kinase [Candidatus Eisenbacteria bacterium]